MKIKHADLKHINLYLLLYGIICVNQVLSFSQLNNIDFVTLLLQGSRWMVLLGLFFMILFTQKYPVSKKGLFGILFMLVALIEMLFYNGKLLVILLALLIIGSRGIDVNKLLKVHLISILFSSSLVILLCLAGILDKGASVKEYGNLAGFLFKSDNVTNSYGFLASNILPITILFTYLYIVILYKEKFKKSWDVFYILIIFFVYFLFGSRNAVVLGLFSVLLRNFISNRPEKYIKFFVPLVKLIFFFSLFISIIFPYLPVSFFRYYDFVDKLMTARLSIVRNAISYYPITLWGYGDLYAVDNDAYLTLDNGYASIFIERGAIIAIVFLFIIWYMLKKAEETKNVYILLFLSVWIIGNIIDATLIHYLTFPIYIIAYNSYFFYEDNVVSKSKKKR